MKVTAEICQVGDEGLTGPADAAVYLIHVAGHAALVDAGTGQGRKGCSKTYKHVRSPLGR